MQPLRRRLLQGSAASVLLPLLGGGLLYPVRASALEWHRTAFSAHTIGEALKAHGSATASETRDIVINAPEIAENGGKVDVEVIINLPQARSLALFADKNPMPLCAALDFLPPAVPYARVQLKLAESSRLRAVVRTSDGKTHVAFREIKVTLGGCGA